ncbi:hypothetical protein JCM11641_007275 [Rhodosporidiobolus odoratus]
MFSGITAALGISGPSTPSVTTSDAPTVNIIAEPETTSVAFPAPNSQQRARQSASSSSTPPTLSTPTFSLTPEDEHDHAALPEVKVDGRGTRPASLAPPGALAPPLTTTGVVKAPKGRVRVEKGFSQLDWAKLNRRGDVDLRGGVTELLRIPPSEVARHNTADDCWHVYEGKVYNVGPFLRYHPGGGEEMMRGAGKDVLAHAWVNYEALLENCLVGFLGSD